MIGVTSYCLGVGSCVSLVLMSSSVLANDQGELSGSQIDDLTNQIAGLSKSIDNLRTEIESLQAGVGLSSSLNGVGNGRGFIDRLQFTRLELEGKCGGPDQSGCQREADAICGVFGFNEATKFGASPFALPELEGVEAVEGFEINAIICQ